MQRIKVNWIPLMTDVIIPYRDTGNGRAEQLARLLERLPSILEPDSRVYIAEQVDSKLFNRGLMLNLGVRAAFADGRGGCWRGGDQRPPESPPLLATPFVSISYASVISMNRDLAYSGL